MNYRNEPGLYDVPFYCHSGNFRFTATTATPMPFESQLNALQKVLRKEVDGFDYLRKKKHCSLSGYLGGNHDVDEMVRDVKMAEKTLKGGQPEESAGDGCTLRSCTRGQRLFNRELMPLHSFQLHAFQNRPLPQGVPLFPGYSAAQEEAEKEMIRQKKAKKQEKKVAKKAAIAAQKKKDLVKLEDVPGPSLQRSTSKNDPKTRTTAKLLKQGNQGQLELDNGGGGVGPMEIQEFPPQPPQVKKKVPRPPVRRRRRKARFAKSSKKKAAPAKKAPTPALDPPQSTSPNEQTDGNEQDEELITPQSQVEGFSLTISLTQNNERWTVIPSTDDVRLDNTHPNPPESYQEWDD